MNSRDHIFGDGYGSGWNSQGPHGLRLNPKARGMLEQQGALTLGTWDSGFVLGSLVRLWREVERHGTEAHGGEAGDSASAE